MMSFRERVLETLAGRTPDRVPAEMWFDDESWARFSRAVGTDNLNDYFNMDVRRVYFQPQPTKMGVDYRYPFPDREFAHCTNNNLAKKVGLLQRKDLAVIGHAGSLCSEIAASMVGGMEPYLIALAENSSSLGSLLDTILEYKTEMMREYAKAGADIIHVGDDFGSQHGLLMSPRMWRNWFKPRISRAIDATRQINPEIAILFHSDGNMEDIIPDFIEIGVNAINPVQPECMDIFKLKERYGNQIVFWGGIGTQKTMPFGTAKEVKEEVKNLLTVGRNGGLVICSSHMVRSDTPLENVVAFFEAVEEFGKTPFTAC